MASINRWREADGAESNCAGSQEMIRKDWGSPSLNLATRAAPLVQFRSDRRIATVSPLDFLRVFNMSQLGQTPGPIDDSIYHRVPNIAQYLSSDKAANLF